MRIRRRWTLVLLLTLCQVVLLAGAILILDRWTTRRVQTSMRRQILEDNRLMSETMGRNLEQMSWVGIRHGDDKWMTLQKLVRESKLPNDGMVCVVRTADASLLCHPKIQEQAKLALMKPGKAKISTRYGVMSIAEATRRSDSTGMPIQGWARMKDGTHYLAINAVPSEGITLMVHQREASVQKAVAMTLRPIRTAALAVAGVLIAISFVANFIIVRRYESRIARWNEELEIQVADRTRALIKTRNAVIFGLAKLSESRDTDTGTHLERIRDYTLVLADELESRFEELNPQFNHDLGIASSLHDIGKVGIPDHILLKPGALTSAERQVINQHSSIGGDCLTAIQNELGEDDFLGLSIQVAYHHHERWDGLGYPDGLSKRDIPLAARIVSVADVYDALTTDRPYKRAMPHDTAAAIIADGADRQFDPVVVEAFFAREEEFRAIMKRYAELDASSKDAESPSQESSESEGTSMQVV